MTARLMRSRTDRKVAGVCGGLAAYFGIDSSIVRAVFVVLAFVPGPSVLPYLILWLVMPEEGATQGHINLSGTLDQLKHQAGRVLNSPASPPSGPNGPAEPWRYDPYTGQPVPPSQHNQQGPTV